MDLYFIEEMIRNGRYCRNDMFLSILALLQVPVGLARGRLQFIIL